jgi:hypothetical protein
VESPRLNYMCPGKDYYALTHVEVQAGLAKAKECLDAMIGSFYKDAIYDDFNMLQRHPNRDAGAKAPSADVQKEPPTSEGGSTP